MSVLSDWLGRQWERAPPSTYFSESKPQTWSQPHRLPGRHLEISKETTKSSLQGVAEEHKWQDDR